MRVVLCLVALPCLTLCDPMDCSPPGSSVHGVLQARILEWIAISSGGSSPPRDRNWVSCIAGRLFTIWATGKTCSISLLLLLCHFSHVRLSVTPWTVAYQAPLSMGFSRQEYWNGLPFPPLGDLPDPAIEPESLTFYCIGRLVLYH